MPNVKELMKILDLTEEEAKELIEEDKKIDKMSMKQVNSDLTDSQKRTIKKMKNSTKSVNAYGKEVKREKKIDTEKQEIITTLIQAMESAGGDEINIVNNEREFTFKKGNRTYKVVLSIPRK